MDEKVLVKSEKYNVKKLCKILVIIGLALSLLMSTINLFSQLGYYADYEETFKQHQKKGCDFYKFYLDEGETCYRCQEHEVGKFAYAVSRTFNMYNILVSLIPFAALSLIGGLIYLWLRSYELTITDKRIHGKVAMVRRLIYLSILYLQ